MERAPMQRKDRERESHMPGRPYRLLIGELARWLIGDLCFLSGHRFPVISLAAEQHLHSRHLKAFRTRPNPCFLPFLFKLGNKAAAF